MPLYEYQCEECDHRFEVIQKSFSDPAVQKCPKCGGPVRKLMSSPAIQFKGSGFYITDYARKDSASKSESSTSADSDSKSDKADKSEKSEKSDKSEKTAAASSSEKATASPKAPADPVK